MTLSPGTRLGPYEIVAAIGAGGMGEVYKAHDTRLERVVAIKVLPEHLAKSAVGRERFEREAKAISQLNHPNICTLHDVGHQDGIDFLVMEYIEGETLADRLARGALPLEQALKNGVQITDGLDKAHRAGIVHRDLKPGNVMLTKSGVKLLDFGLAKPIENETAGDSSDAPTRQKDLTRDRAIVGTPRYMAPEQAEGKSVDARTDIFAFGAVIFEMLTGRKAFDGDSQASLVAAILSSEPPAVSTLRSSLPTSLDRTVAKCLAKDPDDRWQTARDLKDELSWIDSGSSVETTTEKPRRSATIAVAAAVLAAMFAIGVAVWTTMKNPGPLPSFHFREAVPEGLAIRTMFSPPLVFSPDGDQLLLVSGLALENHQLHLRSLDSFDWQELPDSRGADMPFFSPDGQWLGYFANGTLYKASVASGVRVAIADIQQLRAGATWDFDDTIVFSAAGTGLMRVSANGGVPTALTTHAPAEQSHWWPQFVPGGSAVIFSVMRDDGYHPAVLDLTNGEYRILEELGVGKVARYVPTGHIVYEVRGQLYAAAFDVRRLVVTSAPVPVPGFDDVYVSPDSQLAFFTISRTGNLAYLVGTTGERGLVQVSRAGVSSPFFGARGSFSSPRFSPDGTQVAVESGGVWLYDAASGARSRITTQRGSSMPVWTSAGDRITFTTNRFHSIQWKVVGASVDEELHQSDNPAFAGAWSPDDDVLVFQETDPATRSDIWMVTREGEASPLLASEFGEGYPDLSPDGRWMAYVSDESGRDEVYVQPFPELGERITVSTNGGGEPLWSPAGDELFYREADRMMVVSIRSTPRLQVSRPRELFRGPYLSPSTRGGEQRTYDVAPDGEHFLMIEMDEAENAVELRVVLNFFDDLRQLQ